jgi:hypothetical protein
MFILETRYGNDGYAFWFKLLETLGSTEGHIIDCRNEVALEFLRAKTRTTPDLCDEILGLLAKLGAIDPGLWANKIIWSDNFLDRIKDVYKNRRIEMPTKPSFYEQKPDETLVSTDINPQSKVKETKVNKKKILLTYSDDFEKFWRECPNKKDKGEASKTFSAVVEAGVSVEVLIDAMSKYAKSVAGRELKHIKHPSTWLNKQCWNDTYDAITQSDSNTGIAQSQLEELQRRFGH